MDQALSSTGLPTGEPGPVTVSVSRKVRPGMERQYEDWLHRVIAVAAAFPGHQGASVLVPSARTRDRYVLIYRFDSWENAQRWERSPERAEWVARLDGLTEGEAQFKRVTGLEFWFALPEVPAAKSPSQHRMALTLFVVVFALVYPLQLTVAPLLGPAPLWLKTLVIAAIQIGLMTYVVMPKVTRLLKGWLYR